MTPNLDLLLGTIERALEAAILPNVSNPSAREEASLALLFVRWIRDVVDDVGDAERASSRDCREALAAVTARLAADPSSRRTLEALREAHVEPLDRAAPGVLVREEARRIKSLLGLVLRTLRAEGREALARDVRLRLYDLGVREIERERAYGRASAMDPDWPSIPPLADLGTGETLERKGTK
jgi:hypothetical protein